MLAATADLEQLSLEGGALDLPALVLHRHQGH